MFYVVTEGQTLKKTSKIIKYIFIQKCSNVLSKVTVSCVPAALPGVLTDRCDAVGR